MPDSTCTCMSASLCVNILPDSKSTMRLQKFLAHSGVCSRRAAEELIRQGRVKVDGHTVSEMGVQVNPDKNRVEVDGRKITGCQKHVYLLMNKPRGVLTTVKDTHGRRTVMDLLGSTDQRVYPVGRLDLDSEGLLLLTNDGELAQRLLHPSHKIPKKYHVTVKGRPSRKDIQMLMEGVELDGKLTLPCTIKVLGTTRRTTLMEVTLSEGRKRQIRLMMDLVGHPVTRLVRVEMGPLNIKGLSSGKLRKLDDAEVAVLKKAAGL